MNHAHRTSLGLIAAACCLATCLTGCLQPTLGQRLVGRWRAHGSDEASLPMQSQVDSSTGVDRGSEELAPGGEEIVYSEHRCLSGCGPLFRLRWIGQSLRKPYPPVPQQPELEVAPLPPGQLAADACDQELVYPEGGCETCGGPLAALRCRLCSTRGRLRGLFQEATTVEYYNHPRFHPVPTRPVFQASFDSIAGGQVQPVPTASPTPVSPSLPDPPPLMEVKPPAMPPTPEKIHTPDPEPSHSKDRLTQGPPRAVTRRAPSSWIFQPSTPAVPQKPRQAKAYPTAKGWAQTL